MARDLDDPEDRKRAVADILGDGKEASAWERDSFVFSASAQIRIPLRSSDAVRRALALAIAEFEELAKELEAKAVSERTKLLMSQLAIRRLNRRINAYRSPRR